MELLSPTTPIVFFMEASDHLSDAAGKTIALSIAKPGAGWTDRSSAVTEVGGGLYKYTPALGDLPAFGPIILHASAAGCDPFDDVYFVGRDGFVVGDYTAIPVFLAQTIDHVTGATGITPVLTASTAGGAYTIYTGSRTEVSGVGNGFGWYWITHGPSDGLVALAGALAIHAAGTGADITTVLYQVEIAPSSAPWSSAYLLTLFNQMAGRPATDAITDALKYQRLSDGQDAVVMTIAAVAPKALLGAPAAMTTADGGKTWTFGTDGNGYPLTPLAARVYPSLTAIPDFPWTPSVDYRDEGSVIRLPNNVSWSSTLYWQGITPPPPISASVQPIVFPPASRVLIVIKAVQTFAEEYLRNAAVADQMQIKWDREWPNHITAIRKHLRGGSTLGPLSWPFGGASGSLGYVGRW